jgi:hypothetical protein
MRHGKLWLASGVSTFWRRRTGKWGRRPRLQPVSRPAPSALHFLDIALDQGKASIAWTRPAATGLVRMYLSMLRNSSADRTR